MKNKILLFLSTGHFHAHTWRNGALSTAQNFTDSPDGREQFSLFLQSNHDPAYLLVDLIEEDFRYETVPHLRGSDHSALLQRKFEQYYRNTPFRKALLQRRQKDGRRDDEMLFSALTNPALIQPWLEIMQKNCTPIVGIYSVPDISAPLIKDIPSDHLLLLSWEKHAGLRQTYFNSRHLHFSRLTPIADDLPFNAVVASEAERTQQYLKSLSLLPHGDVLDINIICHAHDRREMETRLSDSSDMHYIYSDIQALGKRLKSQATHQYQPAYSDSDATPLFLQLLAASAPRSHYAAAKHTHFFQLWQLRRGLLWLSAALASSLLWSAANLWQGGVLSVESDALRIQANQLSQQAQKIGLGFPTTLATATDMKTSVLLLRKLENYAPPPQTILSGLSATLDEFPRIRVNKLSWQMSAAAETLPTDGTAVTLPAQIILLSGELEKTTGDYRGELDYLQRFQHALEARGHSVNALTLPLDISPKGSIVAKTREDMEKPSQFSYRIIWRAKE